MGKTIEIEKEGTILIIQRKGIAHYRMGFDKNVRAVWIAGGNIVEIIYKLEHLDLEQYNKECEIGENTNGANK